MAAKLTIFWTSSAWEGTLVMIVFLMMEKMLRN